MIAIMVLFQFVAPHARPHTRATVAGRHGSPGRRTVFGIGPLALAAGVAILLPAMASAQTSNSGATAGAQAARSARAPDAEPGASGVYAFTGFGGFSPDDAFSFWRGHTRRAGAGAEHRFGNGLLLQGEVEWLDKPDSRGDRTSFLPSVNVGYEFPGSRVRPFVSGGYTLVTGNLALDYGGGVNVRLAGLVALRLEFRDHHLYFDEPLDSYGVRIGVTIR
ncbi:MAG: outer membrane beta-barrel protein [Vicinamibacterales bacterium]